MAILPLCRQRLCTGSHCSRGFVPLSARRPLPVPRQSGLWRCGQLRWSARSRSPGVAPFKRLWTHIHMPRGLSLQHSANAQSTRSNRDNGGQIFSTSASQHSPCFTRKFFSTAKVKMIALFAMLYVKQENVTELGHPLNIGCKTEFYSHRTIS